MPRPRTVSDAELLGGALAVAARVGPDSVTFAAVAAEVGLSPATLVQRFGSKPALLKAALLHGWDQLEAQTAALDATLPETPGGAIEMLVTLSGPDDPQGFADGLRVLRADFQDPDLMLRGERWGRFLAEALGRRLADGSGPRPDLGALMAAQWQGTILWWGYARCRPLKEVVAEALEAWCVAVGYDLQAMALR